MSTLSLTTSRPNHLLRQSANICFGIVVVGQIIFACYIFGLYAVSGLAGDFERWNTGAAHGYTEGSPWSNLFFGIHVLLAGVITVGGPLQLIKKVRTRFPKFHRINGRVYIFSAFLICIAGLYISWIVGSVGGVVGSIFISINAIIILICAFFTIRKAMSRELRAHRKWAIRLFLAMSGVWFFRVFLMLWLVINQGPVGVDMDTFQGPALNMLYTICYIFPVIGLEIYFKTRASDSKMAKWTLTTFVFVMTAGIAVGTAVAMLGMWLPSFTELEFVF